ncbi:MAG: hypothetical protein IKA24_08245 [Mogibacterium sp.]|jgi:hypothetical protein|nr:hypothetical protein [Mogibacterium sp.]
MKRFKAENGSILALKTALKRLTNGSNTVKWLQRKRKGNQDPDDQQGEKERQTGEDRRSEKEKRRTGLH